MNNNAHAKTKVTFDCSIEEKTYIKMLSAKAHMTLGEYILSHLKADFPKDKKKKSNKETLKAMSDAKKGKGSTYDNMDDFWKEMGVTPSAKNPRSK